MLRTTFIKLSESKSLRNFAENSALGVRFSGRFVAGTQLADAVRATEQVNQWGASVSIDNLGENVTNADEAKHSAELYHRMLDEISSRKLNANISLKLTHMGFDVSEDLAFSLVTELVDHAVKINSFRPRGHGRLALHPAHPGFRSRTASPPWSRRQGRNGHPVLPLPKRG